jgi:D-beta-D-heptose 7-phosphate kinase/D-beta-D-heptose 1-phosphate adenosyltransferase
MGATVTLRKLLRIRRQLRREGKTVVFTNGTFDILHRGHVEYLAAARREGDVLVVGLNTDASIRRIKGRGRPINALKDRAGVLAALRSVDYICAFGEDTPSHLIDLLIPDVLVKGADWSKNNIVGAEVVERHGGKVQRIQLTPGRSTTAMIAKILQAYGAGRRGIPVQPQRKRR